MKNGPYILIVAPENYPGKKYRGRYVYEHQIIWWKLTGEVPPTGYIVHHKDENKHNNSFNNLELKTVSEHLSEHGKAKGITLSRLTCKWCHIIFERPSHNVPKNQINFFCCRSHQVKQQQADLREKRARSPKCFIS